jgi:hypothetical protein
MPLKVAAGIDQPYATNTVPDREGFLKIPNS